MMRRDRVLRVAAGGGLCVVALFGMPGAAHADVCNTYSGTCTQTGGGQSPSGLGGGGTTTPQTDLGTSTHGGVTLPFTGADVVEAGAVGMGALALGVTMTRLGRRRRPVAS